MDGKNAIEIQPPKSVEEEVLVGNVEAMNTEEPLDLSTPARTREPPSTSMIENAVTQREEGINNKVSQSEERLNKKAKSFVKELLKSLNDPSKPKTTKNNGFTRGLKPDAILGGFCHEGDLIFAIMFKNSKLPELITAAELKYRSPSLLIQYYVSRLVYTYK